MLTADGVIDGSWELSVYVTDINTTKTIRTRGDGHIGGLMLKLVNMLEEPSKDWSDHAMWWPENNCWLLRTRRTLDQYEVHAGALLHFTPMHKNVKVILPDLQTRDVRLNFSANVFNNVIAICKILSIRHPEELSLVRTSEPKSKRQSASGHRPASSHASSNFNGSRTQKEPETAGSSDIVIGRSMENLLFDANDSTVTCKTATLDSLTDITTLTASPAIPASQAIKIISRPQNYADKAKVNSRWFDSSMSLMEQETDENDAIMLVYKFCSFFDLNLKYDAVRINQIYEQAKWSLICEHVNCTEEEMIFFAGLHLHIHKQQQKDDGQSTIFWTPDNEGNADDEVDDIGAALDSLQMSLSGTESFGANQAICPVLREYLLFFKPKKFSMKKYKKQYFVLNEGYLSMFNSIEDENRTPPLLNINLRGCDVRGEAKVGENKFLIKLTVLSSETSVEYSLQLDNADKYAEWLAAMHLCARRRTVATTHGNYASEVQAVRDVLKYRLATVTDKSSGSSADENVNPEDFMSATVLRKLGRRQALKRIQEACHSVQNMALFEAKQTFIKAWQSLPECGYAYFIVSFKGSKKKDLIGIGVQRLAQMDMTNGRCIKAWTYDMMTSWSVNWNIEQVKIELGGEADNSTSNVVAFNCLSANCKIVHEFIGGYVFLAMRSLDKNQTLNEDLFQKLTGGWI